MQKIWTPKILLLLLVTCCSFYACSSKKELNAAYVFRWEASGGARDDYYFYGPVGYHLLLQNNDNYEWNGVSLDVEIKNTYNGETRIINKSLAVIKPGQRYSIPLAYIQGIPIRLDIRAKEGMRTFTGKNLLGGPDSPPAPVLDRSISKLNLIKPKDSEDQKDDVQRPRRAIYIGGGQDEGSGVGGL